MWIYQKSQRSPEVRMVHILWLLLFKKKKKIWFSLNPLIGCLKAVYPVITCPIYNMTTCPTSTTHLFNLNITKRPEWKWVCGAGLNMLMNSLSLDILWTPTLLICWRGPMTHYPTDSEVACFREKTEESHPQSVKPKEDPQLPHTARCRSTMSLYGVCMGTEFEMRCQQCDNFKNMSYSRFRKTSLPNSCKLPMPLPPGHLARGTEYNTENTTRKHTHTWWEGLFLEVPLRQSVVAISRYFSPFPTHMHSTSTLGHASIKTESDWSLTDQWAD